MSTASTMLMHPQPHTMQEMRDDGVLVIRTEQDKLVDSVVSFGNEETEVVQLPDRVEEKVVPVPHKVYHTVVIEQPPQQVERVQEVEKVITQIEYVEGKRETKIVEVPEIRKREVEHKIERVIYREEFVDQIVEVPEEKYEHVLTTKDLPTLMPQLCEQITQYEITVPKIKPVYRDVVVPIYVPRFVESQNLVTKSTEETKRQFEMMGIGREVLEKDPKGWDDNAAKNLIMNTFTAANEDPRARQMMQKIEFDAKNQQPRRVVMPPPTQRVLPPAAAAWAAQM